ncbi:MAG: hypothetical protein ACRDCJ_02510 [Metamycoplasmataceae bacterium]
MYAFVIITNKLEFSIAVKNYFVSMCPINYNVVKIFTYGIDTNDSKSEAKILKELKKTLSENPKINKCFIFSDFGDPTFLAETLDKEIDFAIHSKNSLIESGFLAFELINGGAPIESIILALDREVKR